MLFPCGVKSRIPILAVTGTNGKTTTTRLLAHIKQGPPPVGAQGVWKHRKKDGTLIDFHAMWGGWVRMLADDLSRSTGLEVSGVLFDLLGVDRTTGLVHSHGLLAATPMARIREVVFPWENAQVRERLGVDTILERVVVIYGEWRPGRTTVVLVREPVGV